MTIYLVRHGLAAAGVTHLDPGLADLGHRQAQAAANALSGVPAKRLNVSALQRTRETAAPISAALSLEREIRNEVSEVFTPEMDAKAREAMIVPFMRGRWPDQPAELIYWRGNVISALGEMASGTPSDLIIVTHYIVIAAAVGQAVGDERVIPVSVPNCSITSLQITRKTFSLVEAASTAHLPPELVTGGSTVTLGPGPQQP